MRALSAMGGALVTDIEMDEPSARERSHKKGTPAASRQERLAESGRSPGRRPPVRARGLDTGI